MTTSHSSHKRAISPRLSIPFRQAIVTEQKEPATAIDYDAVTMLKLPLPAVIECALCSNKNETQLDTDNKRKLSSVVINFGVFNLASALTQSQIHLADSSNIVPSRSAATVATSLGFHGTTELTTAYH
ncbi:hypothetical protein QL285_021442 [Trifolium repens]|jgi:hypothetical protein|nr:hypothetical protein QL285_021442 [Trifolium repens]